ncbi:hypothetical protein S479_22695 [Salmonella enterica subsp. enterica serovar Newport]|nr:hypothetical protein [Salmonella enterica subsp. enterica serovar Newport]
MFNSNIAKPEIEISNICNAIINNSESIRFAICSGNKILCHYDGDDSIVVIHNGTVSLRRKCDDKIILYFSTPFPYGMINFFLVNDRYYIICESDIDISMINSHDFYKEIEDKNLWKDVFVVTAYLIDIIENSQNNYFNINKSYNVVKICLIQLWSLPTEVREGTSVYKYILSRHNISRSSVSKILKNLTRGKYISTKRGVLLNLNRLPNKY